MPDYAAFARAVDIELLHGLHRAADAEKLLMTRYFPNAAVKDCEAPDEIEQPFRSAGAMVEFG